MHAQVLAAFIAYFCIVLMIGLFGSRRATTEKDFIMGGRKLNFWFTALSAHASDMSVWIFMAFPAAVFMKGAPGCWIAIGLLVGMFLNWQYVAGRLRTQTEQLDSYTLPTFFERRFRDSSGIVRYLTAFFTIVFFSHYLAALLRAMGVTLFANLFGIDPTVGMVISVSVVVAYTLIGGYVTIATIDFFQALFLLAVLLIVPPLALNYIAPGAIAEQAALREISLDVTPKWSWEWALTTLEMAISWCLGYFGMPHILTKFMGIRRVEDMKKSKYLGMSWMFLSLAGAAAVGIIGIAFFPSGLEDPQQVFVHMVHGLFTPFFAGFILCAILAANLSTMDSQILCCATVVSEDLYRRFHGGAVSSKQMLFASRVCVVAVALFALGLALFKEASILANVLYPWAGMGCCFGPLVLLGLYSDRITAKGAIAGLLFGGIFALSWPAWRPFVTDYDISAITFGFPLNMLLVYGVSLATEREINPAGSHTNHPVGHLSHPS